VLVVWARLLASPVVAAALVGSMVLAACASTPSSDAPPISARRIVPADEAAADGTFVVGAALAQRGVLAAEEDVVLTALRAAVAYRNAQGGVGGRAVELRVGDTASSILDATRVVNDLADAGADVIFVGCDVDIAATAARVARRNARLAVSSCASDDTFGTDTAGSFAFDFAPLASAHADALVQRLITSGATTAVTVSDLVPYESTGACQRFGSRYRARGGTVVAEVELATDDDPAATAQRIARVGSAAVLVSCLGRAHVAPVLDAVRTARIGTPIVALGGADSPPWPGGRVDGITFVTTASLWPPDPALAPLVAAGATSGPALHTFLALDVLAQAVVRAPDGRAGSVAEVLRTVTFTTAIGAVRFDARQRAQGAPIVFARTTGDRAELVR